MNTPVLLFGVIASLATGLIIYYNFRILQAFRNDRELTATKLILKEEVPEAFEYLSFSAMIFSVGAILGAVALTLGIEELSYLSEIGGIVMIIGFTLFIRKISYALTEEGKEKEGEDSSEEEG